jgi:hypothetical protein
MTQPEQEARGMLAAEYDEIGDGLNALRIRSGSYVCEEVDVALSALTKALARPTAGIDREVEDWREPYRSMDASGAPDTAGDVGWKWINELAVQAQQAAGEDGGRIFIECPTLGGDAFAMALYDGQTLIALASVFRDPLNFSVLVRWRKEEPAPAKTGERGAVIEECARVRCVGVSRMFDNDKAVLLSLRAKPSDDDLRAIHALLGGE